MVIGERLSLINFGQVGTILAKINDCVVETEYGVDVLPSNLRLASIDLSKALQTLLGF